MHAPRRFMSQIWANNNVTSYSYLFNVLTAGVSQYIGATHFTEIAFVFCNLLGNGYNNSVATPPFLNKPESYSQLARVMTRMWASFIVNQTPNESGVTTLKWPEYTLDDPQNIVFDANVTELAFIEPDTFRAEAIAHMINNA
ncbi:Lipase [Phytophthora palmivora]|uniref:Lipase n=1 Tax=Phytophthora palmivora TaxID=4796 RepID=A0A2P4X1J5_9STRA|nr:Lipase [Phytophthora palmivora]